MTRAFIVHLNVDDGAFDPLALAEDISDDLTSSGHDVQRVTMWTAPTLAATPVQQVPVPFGNPPTTQA